MPPDPPSLACCACACVYLAHAVEYYKDIIRSIKSSVHDCTMTSFVVSDHGCTTQNFWAPVLHYTTGIAHHNKPIFYALNFDV